MTSVLATLNRMTTNLSQDDKNYLSRYGFDFLKCLKQFRVERAFLRECLRYWDPVLHLFRFQRGECVPLTEEFSFICGWGALERPVVIESYSDCKIKFSCFLEIPLTEVETLFDGNALDLISLME